MLADTVGAKALGLGPLSWRRNEAPNANAYTRMKGSETWLVSICNVGWTGGPSTQIGLSLSAFEAERGAHAHVTADAVGTRHHPRSGTGARRWP